MKDVLVATSTEVLSKTSIEIVRKDAINATAHGECLIKMRSGEKPVTLNKVLLVPHVYLN